MKLLSVCVVALSLMMGCSSPGSTATTTPLRTVPHVDLQQYMGAWYEQARIPNRFQRRCAADTQAFYSFLPSGRVRVLNRCRVLDGSLLSAEGEAKVVPNSGQSKLKVSFFKPFYGDYWILALDLKDGWVLIGEPSRKYGWVLSRKPDLDLSLLNHALSQAASQGYELSQFVRSAQTSPLALP